MSSCSNEGGDNVEKDDTVELNNPNENKIGIHKYVSFTISGFN